MGPADILIIVVLAVLLGLALRSVYQRRKTGGCSCGSSGSDCGSCPLAESARTKPSFGSPPDPQSSR